MFQFGPEARCFSFGRTGKLPQRLFGDLRSLLLCLTQASKPADFVIEPGILLLDLSKEIDQPPRRHDLGVWCKRTIMLDALLLGESCNVAAVVEDTPAILLRAYLLGIARGLTLADVEEIGDQLDGDIVVCLVM